MYPPVSVVARSGNPDSTARVVNDRMIKYDHCVVSAARSAPTEKEMDVQIDVF